MKYKVNDPALAKRIEMIVQIVGNRNKLARLANISSPTIKKLLSGRADPTRTTLLALSKATGILLSWLIAGEGPMYESERQKEVMIVAENMEKYLPQDEFVLIPVVQGRISAGGGLVPDNAVESMCAFKRTWIARRGDPAQMSMIKVRGDSMAPTLLDGDVVLVNHAEKDIFDGSIYAIVIDDEILIKRIHKDYKASLLKIKSDNSEYETFTIEYDKIIINGMVIWYARDLTH
ncbi:MAG TPA: hypothetical protein DDW17_09800 [Deltaproteobacteria bacterium]|nr:hypothetical protein [Deltaproteobacteria bacterium]